MKKILILLIALGLVACGGGDGGGGSRSESGGDSSDKNEQSEQIYIPEIRARATTLFINDIISQYHTYFEVIILFNPDYNIPADENIHTCSLSRLDASGNIVNTVEYTPEPLRDMGQGFKHSYTRFYTSVNGNTIKISKRYMDTPFDTFEVQGNSDGYVEVSYLYKCVSDDGYTYKAREKSNLLKIMLK